MCGVCYASLVTDIDFINKKNLINGDAITFSRSGAAIKRDGTVIASSNAIRTDKIVETSCVAYTTVSKKVLAVSPQYIYAAQSTTLLRSTNGTSWSSIGTLPTTPDSGFLTDSGTLILFVGVYGTNPAGEVYRYDGISLTKVIESTSFTAGASPTIWSYSQSGGYIYVGEYRSSYTTDNARKLWLSNDDGLTWTLIHNPSNVTGRHEHHPVACFEDGIPTCYLSYGDGTVKAIYRLQPGSGATWTATEISSANISISPTAGTYSPELGSILWGMDGGDLPAGVRKQVLASTTYSMVWELWVDAVGNNNYNQNANIWKLARYNGLYYAAISNSSEGLHNQAGIVVSSDGINWSYIVHMNDDHLDIVGVGPDNHIWVSLGTGLSSFHFAQPTVIAKTGLLIERASANALDYTPQAQSGTIVDNAYTTDKWSGNDCSRWRNDTVAATATKYIDIGYTVVPDASPGITYYLSAWVKGLVGDGAGNNTGHYGRLWLSLNVVDIDNAGTKYNEERLVCWVDSTWRKILIPVTITSGGAGTPSAGRTRAYAKLYIQVEDGESAIWDILIDGVTIEKAIMPSEYNLNSPARAAETLIYTPTSFPTAFSDVTKFAFRFADIECGAATSGDAVSFVYLRSYAVDNDNFIAVVYDVSDKKIKLVNEVTGTNTIIATLSIPIYFNRDENIAVGLTRTGTTATLYAIAGGIYQTATGTISNHAIVKSYWGTHPAGTQGGSIVFLKGRTYDTVLADANIKVLLQDPATQLTVTPTNSSGSNTFRGRRF